MTLSFPIEKLWAQSPLTHSFAIPNEVLSEVDPTAFAPNDFDTSDFSVEWVGDPLPEVQAELAPHSLQWVRIREVLVFPRARLNLEVHHAEKGQIAQLGFNQPLTVREGQGLAQIPVVLMSGAENALNVTVHRNGRVFRGQLQIKFHPREQFKDPDLRVAIDSSCSPYKVSLETLTSSLPVTPNNGQNNDPHSSQNDWIYVGCRLVQGHDEAHRIPSLEAFLYWEGAGKNIQIGGLDTPASPSSLWGLQLQPNAQEVQLQSQNRTVLLHYKLPDTIHTGSLSLGIGPYSYSFSGNGENTNNLVGMTTLYGSKLIADTLRIVGFGAVTLDSHTLTDLGLYLHFEQFRFLDRRLGVNILIGGHAVGFRSAGEFYVISSLPQGIELVFSDAFIRGKNLTAGAFIYPTISENAYYNMWLRWGGKVFAEINYFSWQANANSKIFNASSLGVTIGFPLAKFW